MDLETIKASIAELHQGGFAWARQCCSGNSDDAAEVLQIVYLKILEGKARYSGNSPFKTWFFSVIRYSAIDYKRKLNRQESLQTALLDSHSHHQEAGGQVDDKEFVVKNALQSLSPRQEEVLNLVFYHDFTIEASAEVMGISIGAARKHYDRGKRNLREKLQKKGYGLR